MKRFFLAGLIDDHIGLSAGQRDAVAKEVKLRFGREPVANLLRFGPGILALIMIPVWRHLGRNYGMFINVAVEAGFAVLILLLIGWMFRRAYARHARSAIRELGFADICIRCGYDLSGRDDEALRCPECGLTNQPYALLEVSSPPGTPPP